MPQRYDMLVIDLDGTLLNSRGIVSPADRKAVFRARQAGLELIIATGRALVESAMPLRQIKHDHLVVAAGGSLLCDASTGRTLERRIMPQGLVEDITHCLLGHGHKVLVLKDANATGYDYLAVGPDELDPASQWWFEVMESTVRFVGSLKDDPHPEDTIRVGVVATGSELEPIAQQLEMELGDRAFLQHWPAVTSSHATRSSTHLLEVFNPDVNKWSMVESYSTSRGIDPRRIAAIGDGLNDVEIIQKCGLGIAMANACGPVLKVADQVTVGHNDHGVAVAIENILDGSW